MALGIKMATYWNAGPGPVEFSIGTLPGHPPDVYRCEPGGTVEGPANYREAFLRLGGLVPVTPEQLAKLHAERAAEAEVEAARAEVEAKAKAEAAEAPCEDESVQPEADESAPGESAAEMPTVGAPIKGRGRRKG